jgi:hypothetical protein
VGVATSTYPDGIDQFNVPTEPEGTPLSSAGTATRNHTQLHDAVDVGLIAVQQNAAVKTHDHSGDGTDRKLGKKLAQVNTHETADTDVAGVSIHHTLGKGATQAAFGNHTHDYRTNEVTNKPLVKCTSTSRPFTPELGDLIWEADTNRMRVWAQFPGEATANQGLYSVDDLERTSTANLGASLWAQTYIQNNDLTHGKLATPGGHSAAWIPAGSTAQRCIARRINSADQHTVTGDQVIIFNTNESVVDWTNSNQDNPTTNDVYFRMSDDGQTYVRAALTWYKGSTGSLLLAYTTTGPTGEQLLGQLAAQSNTPNILWQMRMIGNKFECYMGVEYVGAIVDPVGHTLTGYKGWGMGMQAGPGTFGGQDLPNEISQIGIADATYYTTSAVWQLLPVGDMPKVGVAAGYAQSINPTGSVIEWDVVQEDNFGFYSSSLKTALTISEPGIYFVHASVAWGTNLLGDHAATVLMVNDTRTPHMHWEFVRGYNYVPGFSQTVDVTAYVRLNTGDRLGVAAAHNGTAAQYTGYKKGDQITQLSRLFVAFHSA